MSVQPLGFDGGKPPSRTSESAAIEIIGDFATIHILPWGESADSRSAFLRTGLSATDLEEIELSAAAITALMQLGDVREVRVFDTPGWADPEVTAP